MESFSSIVAQHRRKLFLSRVTKKINRWCHLPCLFIVALPLIDRELFISFCQAGDYLLITG